ncbi:nuclear transport factor 2 family protein [Streptomyces sp. 5-10]|uniref:nuclear transport factor 2 family protein n=1 Tax=Streptomyces sp. 5-10 TaxID=878925 RepID=UPI00168B4FD5|nr:nuclear transport factor 2 family protein [Streptomyces sp. 5-10]MBD3007235.1 nuclear transport factor 2 family protein [Streptomyces sp. 5-10]
MTSQEITEQNKETVRAFIDALNRQDLDGLGALLTDDATWTVCARDIPAAGSHGKKALLGRVLPTAMAIFEPGEPKTEITRMIAEGDMVSAEMVSHGRLRHGAVYSNQYSHMYEIHLGRITAVREYTDTDYAGKIMAGAVAAGHTLDLD